MKKIFIVSLLLMFGFATYCEARVEYDSTGRRVIHNDSIRGRRQAAEIQRQQQRQYQAAAAAKINYEQALKNIEKEETLLKSNYIQNKK